MKRLISLGLVAICLTANAQLASTLKKWVGYTIVDLGVVTSWHDPDGKRGDAFEGCNYDRVLVIDYTKQVTCVGYAYHYAYRPEVVFLRRRGMLKMVVDYEEFDVK